MTAASPPPRRPGSPARKTIGARVACRTRLLRQHPRLALSAALGIVLYLVLPAGMGVTTRLLTAFDVAAVGFLVAVWLMMARATVADMRRRARIEDEGRYAVLILGAAAATAILLAIGFELHGIRDPAAVDAVDGARVALAVATILLAWFFMNTMFALHYAHFFYGDGGGGAARALAFPDRVEPDYWDFLYFSFVIGMTFQVSDVAIVSHRVRRIGLAHGVLAFFFNVVVLALTINIVAGLL